MANVDRPRGILPIDPDAPKTKYTVTTGETVYRGDVLKRVAAGTVEESDADDGDIVIGTAAEKVDDSASAGGKQIMVYDPVGNFVGQADSGTAVAATEIGATCNHVAGTADTNTNLSGHELDSSQMAASGGAQFTIIDILNRPDNAWGEHVDLIVRFNESAYRGGISGV